MPMDHTLVTVRYRGCTLGEQSVFGDLEGQGGYLQLENPMPVGTTLSLTPSEAPDFVIPVRVVRVVELRRSLRGTIKQQPGMQVTVEAEFERFRQFIETGDSSPVELDAEPPAIPEDEEPGEVITTGNFSKPDIESIQAAASKGAASPTAPDPSSEEESEGQANKGKKGKGKKRR